MAFCGALTYAEIGSRYPVTGGYYKIFSYAYHPAVAFAINCSILISNAASVAGVALIGSEYILPVLFPEAGGAAEYHRHPGHCRVLRTEYAGPAHFQRVLNVLMLIKIAMLAVVIVPCSFHPCTIRIPLPGKAPVTCHSGHCSGIRRGTEGYFIYLRGYQQTINFGGGGPASAHHTTCHFIGIFVIVSIYLLVSLSYYKVIGLVELRDTSSIASVVAERMFGPVASTIASVLLFIAVLAYVNVSLLSNPRVMFAMSEDGILPASFRRRMKRRMY